MSYTVEGKVKLIQDVQTFASGFQKREFVVTVEDGQYPQEINFECLGDKSELCAALTPDQQVTVHFDIRGREYNGRYFNNLVAWRIETDAAPGAAPAAAAPAAADQGAPASADDENLPF